MQGVKDTQGRLSASKPHPFAREPTQRAIVQVCVCVFMCACVCVCLSASTKKTFVELPVGQRGRGLLSTTTTAMTTTTMTTTAWCLREAAPLALAFVMERGSKPSTKANLLRKFTVVFAGHVAVDFNTKPHVFRSVAFTAKLRRAKWTHEICIL